MSSKMAARSLRQGGLLLVLLTLSGAGCTAPEVAGPSVGGDVSLHTTKSETNAAVVSGASHGPDGRPEPVATTSSGGSSSPSHCNLTASALLGLSPATNEAADCACPSDTAPTCADGSCAADWNAAMALPACPGGEAFRARCGTYDAVITRSRHGYGFYFYDGTNMVGSLITRRAGEVCRSYAPGFRLPDARCTLTAESGCSETDITVRAKRHAKI